MIIFHNSSIIIIHPRGNRQCAGVRKKSNTSLCRVAEPIKKRKYTADTLGAVVETIAYGYNDSRWGDRLTSFGGQTITYDAMGNPESYLGKTLSWEGKQLTSVTDGTHSYSYSYNEDGLRLRKIVDGTDTDYYYNGSVLMYMVTGTGENKVQQRFSYDAAGNLVALVYKVGSGTSYIYYYLRNAQGDIVKLIDSSGNTVVEYLHQAGVSRLVGDSLGQAHCHNGQLGKHGGCKSALCLFSKEGQKIGAKNWIFNFLQDKIICQYWRH